ncbi:MAG: hypothetical protein KF734_22330 [Saprospiraceae bacterium]|nr:hypothetical protein [Saprospiraceae bacterium]
MRIKHILSLLVMLFVLKWQIHAQVDSQSCVVGKSLKIHKTEGVLTPPTAITPGGSPINSPNRIIWWLHGLGGDEGSWSKALTATEWNVAPGFPARKANCFPPNYVNFQNTISEAAKNVEGQIEGNGVFITQSPEQRRSNFMIAHSLGGLVGRYLDYQYDLDPDPNARGYYGLVTFGSAHQGAQMVNNAIPETGGVAPLVQQFFNKACVGMKAGYAEEIDAQIQSTPIVRWFIQDGWFADLTDTLCGYISEFVPNVAFEDYKNQIVQDFRVGSDVVGLLNSDTSSMPKVAFYGVEDDSTQFWRVMHYLINSPTQEDYFDAVHDDRGVMWRDTNYASALARRWGWYWHGVYYTVNLLDLHGAPLSEYDSVCAYYGLPPGCWVKRDQIPQIVAGWDETLEWWETANDQFRIITGALEAVDSLPLPDEYECWCRYYNSQGQLLSDWAWHSYGSAFPDECESGPLGIGGLYQECQLRQAYGFGFIEKKCDGIVLAELAMHYPDGFGSSALSIVMSGSNHQQMRNDNNLKDVLINLYDGLYGDFFITEEK